MTPLIAVLLALTVIVTLVRRRRRRLPCGRLLHRLQPRLHQTRRRRQAEDDARRLATALLRGDHGHVDPIGYLDAGVVLQPGEVSWGTARTGLVTHTAQSVWITRTHLSWWGRKAETFGQHQTSHARTRCGRVDWLLTSNRLVGHLPGTGELISVWWSTVIGLDVDPRHSRVTLQTTNGWRGKLDGWGVDSVAVAAVAGCHGLDALPTHPALAPLRVSDVGAQSLQPRALGPAGSCSG